MGIENQIQSLRGANSTETQKPTDSINPWDAFKQDFNKTTNFISKAFRNGTTLLGNKFNQFDKALQEKGFSAPEDRKFGDNNYDDDIDDDYDSGASWANSIMNQHYKSTKRQ